MTAALNKPLRWIFGAGAVALLLIAFTATRAEAATYPNGGSPFSGSLEGWAPVQEECKALGLLEVEVLCDAEGEYETATGSLDAKTTLVLNLLGVFNSKVSFRSPDFFVGTAGPATLHLDRQFALGGLANLGPTGGYAVVLIDKTTGAQSVVLQEGLDTVSEAFAGKDAAVSVASGHTYAIQIVTELAGSVTLGLNASGDIRFDNVGLTVTPASSGNPGGNGSSGGSGGSGGAGGAGAGGAGGGSGGKGSGGKGSGGKGATTKLSSSKLVSLFRQGATAAPARLRGNRLLVKVNCPARVGRACHITAQGMLNRHRAATSKRVVKVGKGKGKRIVLHVKPKAKKQVAKRKRLLVRQKVRAGKAHATIYKSRKLMRQHPRR